MFEKDAREFALDLVEQGMIDPMMLLTAALNWMSQAEVRDMLDANELSPRFAEDEEENEEEENEEDRE